MNINEIITQQGIIYDRYLGTSLTLPYSGFDQIKIQPNETVTNFNVNNIINSLYENYLYLYKSAHVASNIIPISSVATLGSTSTKLAWSRGLSASQFLPLSTAGYAFDKSNVLAVNYNNYNNQYVIVTSTGNSLIAFNSNTSFSTITQIFSTTNQYYGTNASWVGINDIIFGDNNNMYVLDLSANSVIQFNAAGFLTNDNLLQNKLVYLNGIGGFGTFNDDTKFNAPNSLTYYNSELYVLDAGNSCIKKYDKNLNWGITYRLFRDFQYAYPVQINHDSFGNFYVLLNSWLIYKYNSDFTSKQIIDITSLSASNDSVKRVVFSSIDTNVFYLVTNNAVYKKLVDNPVDTVGSYLLNRFNFNGAVNITAFTPISAYVNGTAYDYNFMLSNSAGAGFITVFNDNLNATSILTNDIFDVYPLSAITIDKEEYLQNWVINKAVSKLLINHMRLRDNITSRFIYKKDTTTGNILLNGSRYLLPNELNSVLFNQDVTSFIGLNEIFQNNIVNRPFENIFNIQTNLLNALSADVQNYYSTPQIVYLS
jgi:hypothetical protein